MLFSVEMHKRWVLLTFSALKSDLSTPLNDLQFENICVLFASLRLCERKLISLSDIHAVKFTNYFTGQADYKSARATRGQ
jgi:hypothetical protein